MEIWNFLLKVHSSVSDARFNSYADHCRSSGIVNIIWR